MSSLDEKEMQNEVVTIYFKSSLFICKMFAVFCKV